MKRLTIIKAAALSLVLLSPSSFAADNRQCAITAWVDASVRGQVVFNAMDRSGHLESSMYPAEPGQFVTLRVPCEEEITIGATVADVQGVARNAINPATYVLKGGPIYVTDVTQVVFPQNFEPNQ